MLVYLTEYWDADGRKYAGYVAASSWQEAEEKAPPGHRVIGELVESYDVTCGEVGES